MSRLFIALAATALLAGFDNGNPFQTVPEGVVNPTTIAVVANLENIPKGLSGGLYKDTIVRGRDTITALGLPQGQASGGVPEAIYNLEMFGVGATLMPDSNGDPHILNEFQFGVFMLTQCGEPCHAPICSCVA